ncbi:MAG TPA: tryptophan--tRNA ligase [Firmicutes bacterium]|nr:tryptophan--tRNA ligase [Bacillota bacterium]
MSKPRVFSGMRPTGRLHLGNLLGALDNWVKLQDEYDCVFAVVDWHALTTGYEDTREIQQNIRDLVTDYLSAGINPEKSLVIKQSDVKQHAELSLLLSMLTPLSWLERCPTYKEQLRELEGREIMTHGFLGYPVLMAADILVYKAVAVPVGEDQLPHIELTRELARRFNFLYDPVFPEPQALLNEVVLLPGTDGRKMSKSYGNIIEMSASPEEIRKTVANMVTDPQRIRRRDPGNPDVCDVYAFHKVFTKLGIEDIKEGCQTAGIGCVECKRRLADALNEYLDPIRERREAILKKPGIIDEVLEDGAKRARVLAEATLTDVRQAMRI